MKYWLLHYSKYKYTNSLVNADLFYANFTNTTFQKELSADSFTYTYISTYILTFLHYAKFAQSENIGHVNLNLVNTIFG